MRQVPVHLGARSYTVHIGRGLLDAVGAACGRLRLGRRAAVVTQPPVAGLAGRVAASLRDAGFEPAILEVADGEAAKSVREAERLWEGFLAHGLDRTCPVVAVGGGVVGDLAGFAAATYMRGVPLVQVPTTLLAQVDASVGGKVAVNLPRGKNLVGAFHQPRLVVIDPDSLATLAEREYRSGLAEVVKTGAALNAELFEALERDVAGLHRRDPARLEAVIATCCAEKATVVAQDEREESGLRMVLNYGHTVGHALEALSGYARWRHGEAVAIGMTAAGRLAVRLGLAERQTAERQEALLGALGLPTRFEAPDPRTIAETLRHDKKARDGRVAFVLLKAIGQAEVRLDVPTETVLEALREIHR
jgi:3-dehydroquinate synthase